MCFGAISRIVMVIMRLVPVRTPAEHSVVNMLRWLLYIAFVVLAFWLLRAIAPIVAPLVTAFGIAYLLAPITNGLCRLGLSRTVAAGLLLLLFLGGVAAGVAVAAPRLAHDLGDLIAAMPRMLDNFDRWLGKNFGVALPHNWRDYLSSSEAKEALSKAIGPLSEFAQVAVTGALHAVGVFAEALLIPVFAFYFLADWGELLHKLQRLVPPRRRALVVEVAMEIDSVVSGWVRGQGIVVLILCVLYAIGFSVIGVPAALPLGLVVGSLTIVPFVGTFVGAALTLGIVLADGQPMSVLGGAAVLFVILHLLEAAVLTPKIVGHRVGLSETSALFAVMAGGQLLGFVGVVLAVPMAAAVGVLVRRLKTFYEQSAFFGDERDAAVAVSPAMSIVMPAATAAAACTDAGPATGAAPSAAGNDPGAAPQ